MNLRMQIIVAIGVIMAIAIIINMVRKKNLELRYALAWLAVGVGVLILDFSPKTIERIAHLMGIGVPVNMLFFGGFCFSLILIFILTIAMSRMSNRVKKLSQELALFEKRVEEQGKR